MSNDKRSAQTLAIASVLLLTCLIKGLAADPPPPKKPQHPLHRPDPLSRLPGQPLRLPRLRQDQPLPQQRLRPDPPLQRRDQPLRQPHLRHVRAHPLLLPKGLLPLRSGLVLQSVGLCLAVAAYA